MHLQLPSPPFLTVRKESVCWHFKSFLDYTDFTIFVQVPGTNQWYSQNLFEAGWPERFLPQRALDIDPIQGYQAPPSQFEADAHWLFKPKPLLPDEGLFPFSRFCQSHWSPNWPTQSFFLFLEDPHFWKSWAFAIFKRSVRFQGGVFLVDG